MPEYPKLMSHPDLPGATLKAGSRTSERVHAASGWVPGTPTVDDLDGLTRPELDQVAADAGVTDPHTLPNKQAVADAIAATR